MVIKPSSIGKIIAVFCFANMENAFCCSYNPDGSVKSPISALCPAVAGCLSRSGGIAAAYDHYVSFLRILSAKDRHPTLRAVPRFHALILNILRNHLNLDFLQNRQFYSVNNSFFSDCGSTIFGKEIVTVMQS
jgi:hypothetical protein